LRAPNHIQKEVASAKKAKGASLPRKSAGRKPIEEPKRVSARTLAVVGAFAVPGATVESVAAQFGISANSVQTRLSKYRTYAEHPQFPEKMAALGYPELPPIPPHIKPKHTPRAMMIPVEVAQEACALAHESEVVPDPARHMTAIEATAWMVDARVLTTAAIQFLTKAIAGGYLVPNKPSHVQLVSESILRVVGETMRLGWVMQNHDALNGGGQSRRTIVEMNDRQLLNEARKALGLMGEKEK